MKLYSLNLDQMDTRQRGPLEALLNDEESAAFHSTLALLPTPLRQVALSETSDAAVAEELGITRQHVPNVRKKAIREMRRLLAIRGFCVHG